MDGHKNRFFGDTQFIDLFPGRSNKLFQSATPAHLWEWKWEMFYECDRENRRYFAVKILTRALFGSYESNQTRAKICQMVFHPFQTEIDTAQKYSIQLVNEILEIQRISTKETKTVLYWRNESKTYAHFNRPWLINDSKFFEIPKFFHLSDAKFHFLHFTLNPMIQLLIRFILIVQMSNPTWTFTVMQHLTMEWLIFHHNYRFYERCGNDIHKCSTIRKIFRFHENHKNSQKFCSCWHRS